MYSEANEKNRVNISGIIETVNKDMFLSDYSEYVFCNIQVKRKSGVFDSLPVLIAREKINELSLDTGDYIKVFGEFRSYNLINGEKLKLKLFVFAKNVEKIAPTDETQDENSILLDSFLCKAPNYRKTPFEKEITDLLIAVNRKDGNSDYIPAITWGENARLSSTLKVGERLIITGRIQSRTYQKKISDDKSIEMKAIELSVKKITPVENEKNC